MNVFAGVENPETANEDLIREYGMRTFVQANEATRFSGIGSENAGWMLGDEFDFFGGAWRQSTDEVKAGLPERREFVPGRTLMRNGFADRRR
jgi:hypothetical protein